VTSLSCVALRSHDHSSALKIIWREKPLFSAFGTPVEHFQASLIKLGIWILGKWNFNLVCIEV